MIKILDLCKKAELFLTSVKSGNFGHQVISDIHFQTVEIQMRRLLKSGLVRIFSVCLVNLFLIPIIEVWNKQGRCPNLGDYPNLPDFTLKINSKQFFLIELTIRFQHSYVHWCQLWMGSMSKYASFFFFTFLKGDHEISFSREITIVKYTAIKFFLQSEAGLIVWSLYSISWKYL